MANNTVLVLSSLAALIVFGTCVPALAQSEVEALKEASRLDGQGKFEEEVAYLTGAASRQPTSAKLWCALANSRVNLQQFDKCIEESSKAIKLDPSFGEAYVARATGLKGKGKFRESVADLEKALKHDKTLVRAHLVMGLDYVRLEEWNQAIKSFNTLIKEDKTKKFELPAHFFRGISYASTSQHKLAVADFERVVKLQPDNQDALALLKKYRPLIKQLESGKLQEKLKARMKDEPWEDGPAEDKKAAKDKKPPQR